MILEFSRHPPPHTHWATTMIVEALGSLAKQELIKLVSQSKIGDTPPYQGHHWRLVWPMICHMRGEGPFLGCLPSTCIRVQFFVAWHHQKTTLAILKYTFLPFKIRHRYPNSSCVIACDHIALQTPQLAMLAQIPHHKFGANINKW